MKWIDVNERLPKRSEILTDVSKYVLVTDEKNWGYGFYDYTLKYWTYWFTGEIEQNDNKITHWTEPPLSPQKKTFLDEYYFFS